MTDRPVSLLAVDPGDVHVGCAWFHERSDAPLGWACHSTNEYTPEEFLKMLVQRHNRDNLDVLVIERFQVYPDTAKALIGSDLPIARLIGAMQFWATLERIEHVTQPAAWQKPTLGILKVKKMQARSKVDKTGDHALSAELHGWAYLIRAGMTTERFDLGVD